MNQESITVKRPKSWYERQENFSKEQQLYITELERIFNVRTPDGQRIPYVMTSYQQEFHANSINVLGKKAEDILFIKARGISFTFSSAIEIVYTALCFDNQIIPIISQRGDSAKSVLDICKWLIRNANIDLGDIEIMESLIKFKDTNSIIKPYPSGSASNAVRGLRLVRALIDEYAFQQRDKELLAAVQDTMQGDIGQTLIGSTPCGRHNNFFRLVKKPIGFKVFRLPVFDEKKFSPHKNILEQNLTPIAPWIDINKLETKRRRDSNIFMQEQMCFSPETLVYGEQVKQIKDFTIGELVYSDDGELHRIKKISNRDFKGEMFKITIFNGNDVLVTGNHNFLACKRTKSRPEYDNELDWFEAQNLSKGDWIYFPQIESNEKIIKNFKKGYGLQIRKIEKIDYSGKVYNLQVDGSHNYLTKIGIAHNCDFLDDSISFISYTLVKRCEKQTLTNYESVLKNNPFFVYKTGNPIVIGVDVARTTHLTAISVFEIMEDEEGKKVFVQRMLKLVKATEIPKQVEMIEKVIETFPSTVKVRVDMTGLGLGLFEYLRKKKGNMIEGINFSSSIRTGQARQNTKIREYMIVNLKNVMESGQVELLEDEIQSIHLTSMNYEFKVKEDETGHGDVLFADALALLPFDYGTIVSSPLISNVTSLKEFDDETSKDPKDWNLKQRIEWLKRQRK